MILVTTYINPDLDGFSAAIAYAEFLNKTGKPATAGFFGEYQTEVKFAAQKFGINLPSSLENYGDFEQIVLVDVSDLKRLDKNIDPQKVIEVIDHRQVNDFTTFPNAKFLVETIGASATLVAEKIAKSGVEISSEAAKLLSAAIVYHTINFQAPDAIQRDKDIFEWLKGKCDFPKSFLQEVFLAKSDLVGEKLGRAIENDLKQFEFAGRKVVIAQLEIVNGEVLVRDREQEIIDKLAELKNKLKTDFIFLVIIDLEKLIDIFVCGEAKTRDLLKAVSGVEFKNNVAITEKLIFRKVLALYLKEHFERK
ncbi:MAG: DHH family phosphoesterase [bacterium]|nr:DHH family phosphoesterase [bacterium]